MNIKMIPTVLAIGAACLIAAYVKADEGNPDCDGTVNNPCAQPVTLGPYECDPSDTNSVYQIIGTAGSPNIDTCTGSDSGECENVGQEDCTWGSFFYYCDGNVGIIVHQMPVTEYQCDPLD